MTVTLGKAEAVPSDGVTLAVRLFVPAKVTPGDPSQPAHEDSGIQTQRLAAVSPDLLPEALPNP